MDKLWIKWCFEKKKKKKNLKGKIINIKNVLSKTVKFHMYNYNR